MARAKQGTGPGADLGDCLQEEFHLGYLRKAWGRGEGDHEEINKLEGRG